MLPVVCEPPNYAENANNEADDHHITLLKRTDIVGGGDSVGEQQGGRGEADSMEMESEPLGSLETLSNPFAVAVSLFVLLFKRRLSGPTFLSALSLRSSP
jgi:hypothetical protein